MPQISVIIPTYNCAVYLPIAIDSVLCQTFQDYEVIVVDDGSTDNTQVLMGDYLKKHPNLIRYIYQEHKNQSLANNTGLRNARGEFIAFLDADDELSSIALQRAIDVLRSEEAEWCVVNAIEIKNDIVKRRVPKIPNGDHLLHILKSDFVLRSLLFKKQSLFEVGVWDESFFNRNDWELHIRMIEAKKKYVHINEFLYIYKVREKSVSQSNQKNVLFYTLKIIEKHHKRLMKLGNKAVAKIYSELMWDLARQYYYRLKNVRMMLYCLYESLKYDFQLNRVIHALTHNLSKG